MSFNDRLNPGLFAAPALDLKQVEEQEKIEKFNKNHGPGGRFSSGAGGSGNSISSEGGDGIQPGSGGGAARTRLSDNPIMRMETDADRATHTKPTPVDHVAAVPAAVAAFDKAHPDAPRPSTAGATRYGGGGLIDPASVGMGPRPAATAGLRAAHAAPMAAAVAAGTAGTKGPKIHKTYEAAHQSYLEGLKNDGWDVKTHGPSGALKVPHATSPSGQTRLWFKTQSVYRQKVSNKYGMAQFDMGKAHSITQGGDSRHVKYEDFRSFHKLPKKP